MCRPETCSKWAARCRFSSEVFFSLRAPKNFTTFTGNITRSTKSTLKPGHKLKAVTLNEALPRSTPRRRDYYLRMMPEIIERAERDPKQKMALIFRWYLVHTNRLALRGDPGDKVDYQIHCGPALGAFNQWVKGMLSKTGGIVTSTSIAEHLMTGAAKLLDERFHRWQNTTGPERNRKTLEHYIFMLLIKKKFSQVVKANTLKVLPDLVADDVTIDKNLSDLGANSVDRVEVVIYSLEELSLKVPPSELHGLGNLRALVDLLHRHALSK